MTPGYKTTEFWLSLGCATLAGSLGFLQTIDAPWAITSVSVITIVYTLMRSSLKNKQS